MSIKLQDVEKKALQDKSVFFNHDEPELSVFFPPLGQHELFPSSAQQRDMQTIVGLLTRTGLLDEHAYRKAELHVIVNKPTPMCLSLKVERSKIKEMDNMLKESNANIYLSKESAHDAVAHHIRNTSWEEKPTPIR